MLAVTTIQLTRRRVPHPIPYQGSKRRLAPLILTFLPTDVHRLVEPFAGSAAVTLAAAAQGSAKAFVVGDSLRPLVSLWEKITLSPNDVADNYQRIWESQFQDSSIAHYNLVRDEYNATHDPAKLLYLLARCVKNAVRFNRNGEFNQSPDKRRNGMNPGKMRTELASASRLLASKCTFVADDYRAMLKECREGDVVYMDPPYQGVSTGRDNRYHQQLDLGQFIHQLRILNERHIDYIISFDGYCGSQKYGSDLPAELNLTRILVDAGRSSQATLSGRSERTVESIYISERLAPRALKCTQEQRPIPASSRGATLSGSQLLLRDL